MDSMLCDELVQEIFTKISSSSSSSSSASVSLVSKRWLHLYRTSKTSLSLRLTPQFSTVPSLSSLLSHYPFLSSLSLLSSDPTTSSFTSHLLFLVFSTCSNLKHLRFLAGPVSSSSLLSLSTTCAHLGSLSISLSRPLIFNWVVYFPCLKELCVYVTGGDGLEDGTTFDRASVLCPTEDFDAELGLESLSLSGIKAEDLGLDWLWRNCTKLKKLQFKNCESIGCGGSSSSFIKCLNSLEEVELKTCRTIVHGILLKLSENCDSLNSLLIYDGGSRDGLLHFIGNSRSNLQKLDLRLPLDLNNDHLSAIAANFRGLSVLKLQNCCLVTGEGLERLVIALSSVLDELSLINCDVVEREPGLLASLGQNLRRLRKLDLSYNEMLFDKEFISMLVSCNNLIQVNLRGCKGLTSFALVSMLKSCKQLEVLDIVHCSGIKAEAIELFILNSPRLRRILVEDSKLSDVTRTGASRKFIEVVNS